MRSPIAGIFQWDVKVNLWLQNFSPTLDIPFKAFTFMGAGVCFIALLLFIFWCLNRKVGVRLMVLLAISAYINAAAKAIAGQPRPFQFDPRVHQLVEAWGNGFPSGHTQATVVVWGYLSLHYRKAWLTWIAGILMVFVPISRVYLGVHFPTDLLGGYIIGAGILFLYRHYESTGEAYLIRMGTLFQLFVVLSIPLVLMLLYPEKGMLEKKLCASLMGLGVGFILERRWVQFEPGDIWEKRISCFLSGVLPLFVFSFGLPAVAFEMDRNVFLVFLNYSAMGLWVAWIAPWMFVRLKLAKTRRANRFLS